MKCSDPSERRPRDERGFTILEILVTVVVLAVLATVVVLSLRNTVSDADAAAAKTDAKVLDHAEESYRVLHGTYATEQQLVESGYLEEASTIHDIVIVAGGEYELVRVDEQSPTTAPATTPAPTTAAVTTTAVTTTAVTTTTATTTTAAAPVTTAAPTTTAPASLKGVTCAFVVESAWGSGGNGELRITNKSGKSLSTWTVRIERGAQRLTLWNAAIVSFDSSSITATNLDWNGSIRSGDSSSPTGGSVAGSGIAKGLSLPCTVLPNPVTATKVTCSFVVTSAWTSGGNGELRITNGNDMALSSWTVRLTPSGHTLDLWSVDEQRESDRVVTASNQSHNRTVAAGATTVVSGGSVGRSPVTKGMTLPCEVVDAA